MCIVVRWSLNPSSPSLLPEEQHCPAWKELCPQPSPGLPSSAMPQRLLAKIHVLFFPELSWSDWNARLPLCSWAADSLSSIKTSGAFCHLFIWFSVPSSVGFSLYSNLHFAAVTEKNGIFFPSQTRMVRILGKCWSWIAGKRLIGRGRGREYLQLDLSAEICFLWLLSRGSGIPPSSFSKLFHPGN